MIDPETARQAWAEAARRWCSVSDRTTPVIDGASLFYAGQALAVLVPQLLDQLANEERLKRHAEAMCRDWRKQNHALGERCRQLETAATAFLDALDAARNLKRLSDTDEYAEAVVRAGATKDVLRAALGDPKETDGRR